jgi:hypothetical protein
VNRDHPAGRAISRAAQSATNYLPGPAGSGVPGGQPRRTQQHNHRPTRPGVRSRNGPTNVAVELAVSLAFPAPTTAPTPLDCAYMPVLAALCSISSDTACNRRWPCLAISHAWVRCRWFTYTSRWATACLAIPAVMVVCVLVSM